MNERENRLEVFETRRIFAASAAAVYSAFTDTEAYSKWGCGDLYDNLALDIDPREGGVLHHRVRSKADGSLWTFFGVYRKLEAHRALEYTFDWKQDWREPATPSLVSITLSEVDGGTEILLRHSRLPEPAVPSTESHWANFLETLGDELARGVIL